jgi:hypothetical protein
MIRELRELHAPSVALDSLHCEGCDSYDEQPEWPCRTAEVIYSGEEVSDVKEAFALYRRWSGQANYRKRMSSGWGMGDEIIKIYRPMLLEALKPLPIFKMPPSRIGEVSAGRLRSN